MDLPACAAGADDRIQTGVVEEANPHVNPATITARGIFEEPVVERIDGRGVSWMGFALGAIDDELGRGDQLFHLDPKPLGGFGCHFFHGLASETDGVSEVDP